jgi:Domain of unknown function (DUF4190)
MYNDPNQNVPQYPPSYPPQPSYPPSTPPYTPPPAYPESTPQYAPPPQGYGYAAPPMAPATSGWAIASLVCALVFPVFGILPIIFGYVGRNEIRNSGGRITGDGLALAGLIIGWIEAALCVLFVALIIISIIAANAPNGTNF